MRAAATPPTFREAGSRTARCLLIFSRRGNALLTWRPLLGLIVAMSVQLPLPARWAHIESRRDPLDRLASLQDDLAGAKAAIKAVLEGVAARHGITARDVNEAIEGYAADMLSDMIFHVERDLEREIEGEQERGP